MQMWLKQLLMLYEVVEAAKPHLRRRIGLRVFGHSGNAEMPKIRLNYLR